MRLIAWVDAHDTYEYFFHIKKGFIVEIKKFVCRKYFASKGIYIPKPTRR